MAPRLIAVRGYINLILHEDTTQRDLDTMRSEASCSQMESSFAAFGVRPFGRLPRAHDQSKGPSRGDVTADWSDCREVFLCSPTGGSRDLRQDMMGFLRRCLSQQAEVRIALYHGVYGVLLAGGFPSQPLTTP